MSGEEVQLRGAFSLQFLPAHNDVSTVLRRVEDLKRCSGSCRRPEEEAKGKEKSQTSRRSDVAALILGNWERSSTRVRIPKKEGGRSATADQNEAFTLIFIHGQLKSASVAQTSPTDRSPQVCSPVTSPNLRQDGRSGGRQGGCSPPDLRFDFQRSRVAKSHGNPGEKQRGRAVLHLLST